MVHLKVKGAKMAVLGLVKKKQAPRIKKEDEGLAAKIETVTNIDTRSQRKIKTGVGAVKFFGAFWPVLKSSSKKALGAQTSTRGVTAIPGLGLIARQAAAEGYETTIIQKDGALTSVNAKNFANAVRKGKGFAFLKTDGNTMHVGVMCATSRGVFTSDAMKKVFDGFKQKAAEKGATKITASTWIFAKNKRIGESVKAKPINEVEQAKHNELARKFLGYRTKRPMVQKIIDTLFRKKTLPVYEMPV